MNTSFKRVSLENTLPNNKSKRRPQYSIEVPNVAAEALTDEQARYVYENPFGVRFPNVDPVGFFLSPPLFPVYESAPKASGLHFFLQELVFKFKPNHFPPFRQMFYQLCDIELPIIQSMVDNDEPEDASTCHAKHGWLSADLLAHCRAEVTKNIQDLIRGKGVSDDKRTATSDNESEDENPYPDNMENEMDMDLLDYMDS